MHPDTQEEDGHTSDSSAGSECLGKQVCSRVHAHTHTHTHTHTPLGSNLTEIIKTSRDRIRLSDKLGYALHVNKSFPNGAESRQEESCVSFRRGPGL